MNHLNDKLLELIMILDDIQSDSLDHDRRKRLLLEIHHLKVEARQEQSDAVTNELMALEYSLGFGQNGQDVSFSDIQEHRHRLSQLAGISEPDNKSLAEDYFNEPEPEPLDIIKEQPLTQDNEQIELLPETAAILHLTLCNCKSRDEAREIALGLIENRFAACVNFVANIGAIYRWQDSIEDTSECQLQIKSVPDRDQDIKDYIKAHHSYDVPEIITVPVNQANQEYIQWVIKQTT